MEIIVFVMVVDDGALSLSIMLVICNPAAYPYYLCLMTTITTDEAIVIIIIIVVVITIITVGFKLIRSIKPTNFTILEGSNIFIF